MLKSKERGASAVEFALVLPILLVLVFGIIEFGLILYNKATLTNASREGARFGISFRSPRIPAEEIRARVREKCFLIPPATLPDENIILTVGVENTPYNPATFRTGDVLNVEISYTYDFIVFADVIGLLQEGAWSSQLNLGARSSMRGE